MVASRGLRSEEPRRTKLEAAVTPERAAGEAKYLKLGDRENLGVDGTGIHRIISEYVREFGPPRDLALVDHWFRGSLEEASWAVRFPAAQPAYTTATWEFAERWCGMPDTWVLADPISTILVAGHLEEGVISEPLLREWARREEPFWSRRIALVSTTSLNAGLGGPTRTRLKRIGRVPNAGSRPQPELTLELLESSVHDKRHFARLGIGWAPRTLAEVAPQETADFVVRHRRIMTKATLGKARLAEDGKGPKRLYLIRH